SSRKQEQEAGKMNGSQSPCHLLLPSASYFSSFIPFLLRCWRVWRRRFVVASDYYGHLIRPEIFLYRRVCLFECDGVDDLRVAVNVVRAQIVELRVPERCGYASVRSKRDFERAYGRRFLCGQLLRLDSVLHV